MNTGRREVPDKYKVESVDEKSVERFMNSRAAEGWRLVSIFADRGYKEFYVLVWER